jgi:membrane fusion protein (multidrug efflux system)
MPLSCSRWIVVLAAAVLACKDAAPPAPPPVEVVVAPVEVRKVSLTSEWIGTTEGEIDAEIRAQVPGYLISQDYTEGSVVAKGALLFRVDPRPFQASLEQARGELARARAELGRANQDVARYRPLAKEGAVSQQELDTAIQRQLGAAGAVAAAQAAADKAQIDLSFTRIESPISGIAGIALAKIGDLVGPNASRPLTTVSQVDPIQVAFPVSEREYLRYADAIRQAVERGRFGEGTLELVLADGSIYPHHGTATPAGREIDPATGTIMVKGRFPNPNLLLRPGQYARVRTVTDVRENAIVVPQRAVQELQGTQQVALVKPDNTVEMRVVKTGPRDGSGWVIESGLAPGDRLVVEGLQKVRNGVTVAPAPAAPAVASPPPASGNS